MRPIVDAGSSAGHVPKERREPRHEQAIGLGGVSKHRPVVGIHDGGAGSDDLHSCRQLHGPWLGGVGEGGRRRSEQKSGWPGKGGGGAGTVQ